MPHSCHGATRYRAQPRVGKGREPVSALLGLVNAGCALAERAGLGADALEPERLIAAARASARLEDFGTEDFAEPLAALLGALNGEAGLSPFGRFAARWDAKRFLINLLILRQRERADPGIGEQTIAPPIFVTGVPRSGTTFLHALLAEDTANLVPRVWQTIYPDPRHPAAGRGAGPARVDRQITFFRRLVPELDHLHPLDANRPQECTEITAHVFRSLRFDSTHDVPSYRRWLAASGHIDAYRFHRRFLGHLQRQTGPGRWVLKSPDHVFALDALRRVYPEARLVFVHRDPLRVLPSVARLTQVLRTPFARSVDPLHVGRQISLDWASGVARIIEASRTWPASQLFHVQYRALTADPLGTVAALYRHFDLDLAPAAAERMADAIARAPRGGYGVNCYRFADFGLDPQTERARYRDYMATFGIEPELAEADDARPAGTRPGGAPVASDAQISASR